MHILNQFEVKNSLYFSDIQAKSQASLKWYYLLTYGLYSETIFYYYIVYYKGKENT